MAAPVRAAWMSRQEWEDVRTWVSSNDAVLWQQAIDQIQLWKYRVNYKLSDSIELTQMVLINQLACKTGGLMHQELEQLRLSLAMTVIRFVTFITDAKQARMEKRPVHVLAQKAGIPVWIVDVRHEATHSRLPSLPLLVKALGFAHNFLKDRYWNQESTSHDASCYDNDPGNNDDKDACWEIQSSTAEQAVTSVSIHQYLQDLVVEYQRIQHGGCAGASEAASMLLQQNADFVLSNKKAFLDVLCEDGYFLLSTDQLQAMELHHAVSTSRVPKLPRRLLSFWKPLLSFVVRTGVKHELILSLARALTDVVNVRNWQIVSWIQHLLQPKGGQPSDRTYSDLHWPGLVAHCMSSMSALVPGLLQLIMDLMPEVHGLNKRKLIELSQAYLQANGACSTRTVQCTKGAVYTASDVHRSAQGEPVSGDMGVPIVSKCPWRPAPCDANWVAIPIGHVFHDNDSGDTGLPDKAHRYLNLAMYSQLQQQVNQPLSRSSRLGYSSLGSSPKEDTGLANDGCENLLGVAGDDSFMYHETEPHRSGARICDADVTRLYGDDWDDGRHQEPCSMHQLPVLIASVDELGW